MNKPTYCEAHGVNLVQNERCMLCERAIEFPRFRVQIDSMWSKQPHFVDVTADDNFGALRVAMDQNKHASSAKVVRRYAPGEALLGNW